MSDEADGVWGQMFAKVVRQGYLARVSFKVVEAQRNMREGLAIAPPSLEARFAGVLGEIDDLVGRVEEMKHEGH